MELPQGEAFESFSGHMLPMGLTGEQSGADLKSFWSPCPSIPPMPVPKGGVLPGDTLSFELNRPFSMSNCPWKGLTVITLWHLSVNLFIGSSSCLNRRASWAAEDRQILKRQRARETEDYRLHLSP